MIKEKSKTWAKISAKLGVVFSRLPFPPSYYTWSTLPTAFLGMIAMIYGYVIFAVVLFSFAGILDLIDGAVARQTNHVSHAGAFLDGSLDRFIDFMLIFSYFWLPIVTPGLSLGKWLCITLFFAIMPSFEVAYANHRQAVIDPEEKLIWRILNRGEMYTLMLIIPLVALYNPAWAGYLLLILVFFSFITTLQTLFSTLYLAKNKPSSTHQGDLIE